MIKFANDTWFDEQAVLSRVKNLWMQQMTCRATGDVEPLRPYFSEALYQKELDDLARDQREGKIRQAGRPAVLDGVLEQAGAAEGREALRCRLFTRYTPREVRQHDNEVLREGKETFFHEEWLLTRPAGTKTPQPGAPISVNCPNCGAPFSLYKSAKCPMCKSLIPVPDFTWTVEEITVVIG